MGIEALIVVVALCIVPLTRGSYRQLAKLNLQHTWTLGIVLIGYMIIEFAPITKDRYDDIGFIILLATYVYLLSFAIVNIKIKGMWIALIGLMSNALVISLNRGMPVSTSGGYIVNETIRNQAASSHDVLSFLGDIIPINQLSIAISPGDIIFAIGIFAVIYFGSRKPIETQDMDSQYLLQANAIQIDLTKEEPTDEHNLVVDLKETEPVISIPNANHRPNVRKNDEKLQKKLLKREQSRAHKRWKKSHGLAGLPTKEALGFDESSMEIVQVAQE